jgi:hypothetical protein
MCITLSAKVFLSPHSFRGFYGKLCGWDSKLAAHPERSHGGHHNAHAVHVIDDVLVQQLNRSRYSIARWARSVQRLQEA